jgi:hypothetical protein
MSDNVDGGDDADAQAEAQYDGDPDLQSLLARAAKSPTVRRDNAGNAGDNDHRARVHEIARRVLVEDADLFQRIADYDADDDNNDNMGTS